LAVKTKKLQLLAEVLDVRYCIIF